MSFNIEVQGGSSVRLPTAGKYCDRDIVVTATGGGGSDTQFKDFCEGALTEIYDESITKLRTSAFRDATQLKSVRLPNVTSIGGNAFRDCSNLEVIDLPQATGFTGTYTFSGCGKLTQVNVTGFTALSNYAFQNCSSLARIELGNLGSIGAGAFSGCSSLKTVIIRKVGTSATPLPVTNAFTNTPIANETGHIYVPASAVDAFKTAKNWSTYAAQIRAIEDYPDICGQ